MRRETGDDQKSRMRREARAARRRAILRGQRGQSTVEFALTLVLLMGFVLFYLQLSLVMAFGNYVHYATFMAARAYLSAGPSKEDQVARAKGVLVKMLKKSEGQPGIDRFPSIAKGDGAGDGDLKGASINDHEKFNAVDPDFSWLQGVRYAFKSRLFLIPLERGGGAAAASSVTLKSESWLGREPPYDECKQEMISKKGLFDNGC